MVDATVSPERRDFYVYVIFRPNGIPCYVGKGQGFRWRVHFYLKSQHWNKGLAQLIADAGGELPVIKVRECLTQEQAFETEIALIAAIGRERNGGLLVNQTDGGGGSCGSTASPERRAKLSAAHKGRKPSRETRAKYAVAAANRVWSSESRAKISASKRGRKRNSDTVAKMRVAAKSQMAKPEARARIAEANRRREWTPEDRAKHGKRMAEVWRRLHPL